MTIAIAHKFTSMTADAQASGIIKPSNWNDTHSISMAAGSLLGNSAAFSGTAQEIAVNVTDFNLNASALALAATGIAAGVYTNPVMTVDAKGRVFAIASSANVGGARADEQYLLATADAANLPNARVATDATAITFDKTVAGQIKAKLGQLTGDVTTASADSLATTIANAAVTFAKFQNIAGLSVFGNSGSSAGVGGNITGTADQFLQVNHAASALGFVSMSGDATLSGGALTIANAAVTYAKIQNGTGLSVVGRAANSGGVNADITGTASQFLGVNSGGTSVAFQTMSGDATLSGGALTIASAAVTYAKIQNVAGLSVFGRSASSSGVGANITGTASQVLAVNSAGTALAFTGSPSLTSLNLAAGLVGSPSLNFGSSTDTGLYQPAAGWLAITQASQFVAGVPGAQRFTIWQGFPLTFDSGGGTGDTGLSRTGAATLALGNGTAADTSGTLQCHSVIANSVNIATPTIDLVVVIGDGVNVISTGVNANWTSQFDFAATIVQWSVVSDESGSISIDVWKTTYTAFDAGSTHPVAADKISATSPITFSTATKGQDSTLSGWTKSISAGDILAFNVASVTSCKRVVINMKLTKTS